MGTYLLTWNPAHPEAWESDPIAEVAKKTASGTPHEMRWSTGNTKSVKAGDRVFLLKQGAEPRGLVAAGTVIEGNYEADHWNSERRQKGEKAWYVRAAFEQVLDPANHAPLSTASFTSGPLAAVHWTPYSSGNQIPDEAALELEALWAEYAGEPEPVSDQVAVGTEKKRVTKNPPWQRDELILALDLYVRHGGKYLGESHEEVVALSQTLNALPIHAGGRSEGYRNPNGVSMKLLNFRRLDPAHEGVGLTRGNKLEEVVWKAFAGDPERLRQVAAAIIDWYGQVSESPDPELDEEEFPEGRVLFRLHRTRERKPGVIAAAKAIALQKDGQLICRVCRFSFPEKYGTLGEGFIEGHHTKPVSELSEGAVTRAADIALVCSNCHRMLHRRRPWLSVEELGELVDKPKE